VGASPDGAAADPAAGAPGDPGAPGAPTDPGDPDARDPSEAQVESFARAYVTLVSIESEYGPQLQQAETPAEAEGIREQAQAQMREAITDHGLSMSEFEAIGAAVESDETLRSRVETKIRALEDQGPPASMDGDDASR
jgi:hypothetical protein